MGAPPAPGSGASPGAVVAGGADPSFAVPLPGTLAFGAAVGGRAAAAAVVVVVVLMAGGGEAVLLVVVEVVVGVVVVVFVAVVVVAVGVVVVEVAVDVVVVAVVLVAVEVVDVVVVVVFEVVVVAVVVVVHWSSFSHSGLHPAALKAALAFQLVPPAVARLLQLDMPAWSNMRIRLVTAPSCHERRCWSKFLALLNIPSMAFTDPVCHELRGWLNLDPPANMLLKSCAALVRLQPAPRLVAD